jgi:hypothetical protein
MAGGAQANDILEILRKVLQIAALILVENDEVHIDAALSQEVVREE